MTERPIQELDPETRKALSRCFSCKHMVFHGHLHCNASGGHCDIRGQKPLIKKVLQAQGKGSFESTG